jgi:hypothetical protein
VGANYGIYKEETMEVINAHFNPYTTDLTADKFDITPFKREITERANTEGTGLPRRWIRSCPTSAKSPRDPRKSPRRRRKSRPPWRRLRRWWKPARCASPL